MKSDYGQNPTKYKTSSGKTPTKKAQRHKNVKKLPQTHYFPISLPRSSPVFLQRERDSPRARIGLEPEISDFIVGCVNYIIFRKCFCFYT